MTVSVKYWLPTTWLIVFIFWLLVGSNFAINWALRLLTIFLVIWACLAVANFVRARIVAMKHGEPIVTESTLRGLLFGALIVGLVLRIIGWDHGHPGVVAWIGGITMLVAIAGLIALQFFVERARARNPSFFFNPNWKYGLLLLCIVTLSIQGLVRPDGAASTLNVAVFWLALVTLLVQMVGRWIQRRRGDGSTRTTTRHVA